MKTALDKLSGCINLHCFYICSAVWMIEGGLFNDFVLSKQICYRIFSLYIEIRLCTQTPANKHTAINFTFRANLKVFSFLNPRRLFVLLS